MLDREMGQISGDLTRLAVQAGMTQGELEAACRMWFDQHGQRWHDVAMSILRERVRNVDLRMMAKVEQVLYEEP